MLETMPRPAGSAPKNAPKALTVRIDGDLVDELRAIAEREDRSMNYIAARVIREGLKKERRQ